MADWRQQDKKTGLQVEHNTHSRPNGTRLNGEVVIGWVGCPTTTTLGAGCGSGGTCTRRTQEVNQVERLSHDYFSGTVIGGSCCTLHLRQLFKSQSTQR